MISVLIVNYHSAHLTKKAVSSVLGEGGDIEVIIVDNTSTPGERERLAELSNACPVTLIMNQDNAGFARANNQAFSVAKGEYIFLLNPDAYVVPPCLNSLKTFMEHHPEAGAVSPAVYWDDGMQFLFPCYPFPSPFQDFCTKVSGLSNTFGTLYSLHERRKNLGLWRSSLPVKVQNLHGGVVLLRRSSVERAGGLFDERFFLFYEDTDLFFRLRKRGYVLYIVPEAKAVHNYTHRQHKLERMAETHRLYYEKHFSGSLLARLTALIPWHAPRGIVDYGEWDVPPSFPVPEGLIGKYLYEWSPDALFRPSLGCFGSGAVFVLPEQVWSFLDPGVYYSRITDPDSMFPRTPTLLWRKKG